MVQVLAATRRLAGAIQLFAVTVRVLAGTVQVLAATRRLAEAIQLFSVVVWLTRVIRNSAAAIRIFAVTM
jgi:hypothetical protein